MRARSVLLCLPLASAVVLTGIANIIAMDRGLGVSTGHPETIALVEDYLQQHAGDGAARADAG